MEKWDFTIIQQMKRQREADENRDITYAEMAAEMGMSTGTLWSLATGKTQDALLSTVLKIAAYFEVPVEHFRIEDDTTSAEGNKRGSTRERVEPAFAAS